MVELETFSLARSRTVILRSGSDDQIFAVCLHVSNELPDRRPLILIIDDNDEHVEFLRIAMGTRFRIVTASDGLDGYHVACSLKPDVILVDMVMPIVDGLTVVRKLRINPATATVPVVLITGFDLSKDGLEEGVDVTAILRKPCHQGEILSAIRSALRESPEGTKPVPL